MSPHLLVIDVPIDGRKFSIFMVIKKSESTQNVESFSSYMIRVRIIRTNFAYADLL